MPNERTERPLVSVAMPAYNMRPYVEHALRSVLQQNYPNLEIIVSDDCSTDGTREWLVEFAAREPRVKLLLPSQNLGCAPNANLCLRACAGRYVALFSADDLMLPGKITHQVEALERPENAGFVGCVTATECFDSDSGSTLRLIDPVRLLGRNRLELADYLKHGGGPAHPCTWLVRRNVIPEHGFDERFRLAPDMILCCEIAAQGPLLALDAVFTRYRIRREGLSRNGFGDDLYMVFAVMESRHPEMSGPARMGRAVSSYSEASVAMRNGDLLLARRKLKYSLRQRLTTRAILRLCLCYSPFGLTLARAMSRLRQKRAARYTALHVPTA
jgi:glycosyltransferase involved in cell wall biosynthesis